ncbi:MAG: C45 family peptidase [Bacteroidales bacterium]|jgi:hypothetical protein
MNRLVNFSIPVLLSVLISCNTSPGKKEALSKEKILSSASRIDKNNWIYVNLRGSPHEIGFQHGYLLAKEIIDLRGALSMLNEKSTGKDWNFYRGESLKLFWKNVPEEYQAEIDGIVSGVNERLGLKSVDREDIVAMNSILETSWYYVPWLEAQKNPNPPGHCSAIAATGSWTKDGKIVMAHNSWVDFVMGERWNIIFDIVPERGNRIIMDGLPGFIHSGDDFCINSAGLVVTETTISAFKGFDPAGVAEFVRARKAVQYASSIAEFITIMKDGNNGGYANDWLVGDNKTGEIARLELGLKHQIFEITTDGCLVGSNFPVYKDVIKDETSFDTTDMSSSANARKVRWEQLLKDYKGKIDVDAAMRFMGDHYDTWHKLNKASSLSLCGHNDEDENGCPSFDWRPFYPDGAVQAKATDGTLAGEMRFWAIMGRPCGEPFYADKFLMAHPEFSWQKYYLHDMPGEKWTLFQKDMK